MILGQYGALLAVTWWYFISMGRYWLVLGGTGSVWGGNGWYLVELGQYWAVVAVTWWFLVSVWQYWLVHGGSGSVKLDTA